MATNNDQQPLQQANKQSLSKRQRRAAGPNPSNTWQQQPRIKSAGARARAYISYAGLADDVADGKRGKVDSAVDNKKKLSSSSTSSRLAEMLDPQLDLHSPEVKFGRLLGGTDQRSRHAAVKMLREYLRARSDFTNGGAGLSELDLMKLWKGMWYTLYMADKTPVQDKLSKILAELMWCLSGTEEEDEYAGQLYLRMEDPTEFGDNGEEVDSEMCDGDDGEEQARHGLFQDGDVFEDDDGDVMEIIEMDENSDEEDVESSDEDAMEGEGDEETRIRDMNETHCRGAHLVSLYFSTFLRTVRREWGNVDKHRVDKFYTAVRFMVSEVYKYMSKRHWNLGILRLFNDALYTEGLSAETPGLTNGLRYHLIDICVDELAKVNRDSELPLTEATILDCLEPFFALAQKAEDKNVQKRVMDNVMLKFLNEYSFVSATAMDEEVEDDEKVLVFNQVHVGTVSKFIFEIASDNDTDDRFRKSLYEMHKTFVRQIRAAGRDVDIDQCFLEDGQEVDGGDGANVDEEGKSEKVKDVKEEEKPEVEVDGVIANGKEGVEAVNESTSTPTKSEKKKKRKKKKEKRDSEVQETRKTAEEDDASATPKKPPSKKKKSVEEEDDCSTPKKSSSKKKKAGKKEDDNTTPKKSSSKKKPLKEGSEAGEFAKEDVKSDSLETPKPLKKEENSASSVPKPKSSKKKRKKQDSEPNKNESDTITSHVETPTPKQRKKQKSPPSVDPRSMHSPDQFISPTNSDNEAVVSEDSASRRVSFGKINHCKSHKASMKAMKTLAKDRYDTVSRTPDKGILRPKDIGVRSSAKKTKNRPPLAPPSSRKNRGNKRG
eukprot:CAMPEP_0181101254 /NCGR_PEP_ID=MMETSP1071-20121207/13650_1 /TAXON_ID=35127 /ORGANISM="Thalassiosira sp., Strain NH16" /LENGTH=828 /DNA_ID=CAMNT_0023184081 /DNA_START=268 /DNA_END=2754 /DNA_ORIENTATION=-